MDGDRFSESEFGDLLQEAVVRMQNAQECQRQPRHPFLINVIEAARVVVEFHQNKVHPPKERPPYVCPEGIEEHNEFPFTCSCGVTEEMWRKVLDVIEEERRPCWFCGEPAGSGTFHPRHEDMWMSGPRVWGTVWHGYRDM